MNTAAPLIGLSLLACCLCACSPGRDRSVSADASAPSSLRDPLAQTADRAIIEAGDLPSLLASARTPIVLDVRDAKDYAQGHVRGAIHAPGAEWHRLSHAPDTGLENRVFWAGRLGSLGLTTSSQVIVYDQGVMTEAARVWFILQHFGVGDVRVVNGGFPLIKEATAAAPKLVTIDTTTPSPREFVLASEEPATLVGFADRRALREAIATGNVQVLDARSANEFAGTDARGNPRAGHVPGAHNLPHSQLLDERGRLRPREELAQLFDRAGFRTGTTIIAHCQSGGRSSLAALAAARAGYGPVANYYLSFADWSRDASCPIEGPVANTPGN